MGTANAQISRLVKSTEVTMKTHPYTEAAVGQGVSDKNTLAKNARCQKASVKNDMKKKVKSAKKKAKKVMKKAKKKAKKAKCKAKKAAKKKVKKAKKKAKKCGKKAAK